MCTKGEYSSTILGTISGHAAGLLMQPPVLHMGKRPKENRSIFSTIIILHFWVELVVLIDLLRLAIGHLKLNFCVIRQAFSC